MENGSFEPLFVPSLKFPYPPRDFLHILSHRNKMSMSYSDLPYASNDNMTGEETDEDSSDCSLISVEKPHADVSDVERLRRFLSYCLAVDYGLQSSCPDFTHLGKLCYDDYTRKHPNDPSLLLSWTDDCCTHKDIECYVLEPAEALDIPSGKRVANNHMKAC